MQFISPLIYTTNNCFICSFFRFRVSARKKFPLLLHSLAGHGRWQLTIAVSRWVITCSMQFVMAETAVAKEALPLSC
jgi:hypothetical protein